MAALPVAISEASIAKSMEHLPLVGMPFAQLPLELSALIRDLLAPVDIVRCSRVCKAWQNVLCSRDSVLALSRGQPTGHLFQLIEAHHYAIPRVALRLPQVVDQPSFSCSPMQLVGSLFMRRIGYCKLQIMNLLTGTEKVLKVGPGVQHVALTEDRVAFFQNDLHICRHDSSGLEVIPWAKSFTQAVASEGNTFVAIRNGQGGFNCMRVRDQVERFFLRTREAWRPCAVAIDGEDIIIFVLSEGLSIHRGDLEQVIPCQWTDTIEVLKTGEKEVRVRLDKENFMVDLRTLKWRRMSFSKQAAYWKGNIYGTRGSAIVSKRRFWHDELPGCKQARIFVNDRFLVAAHTRRSEGCFCLRAFCFHQMEGLSEAGFHRQIK